MTEEIIIGPFPKVISTREKEDFLKIFGAKKIVHLRGKKSEAFSIVRFDNQANLENAIRQIHQMKIFGTRLIAKYNDRNYHEKYNTTSVQQRRSSKEDTTAIQSEKVRNALVEYESHLAAISSRFDIKNPINPKLRYEYPPPSSAVLKRIIRSLLSVPKFYTQVLHLMNKMNLSCPFVPTADNETDLNIPDITFTPQEHDQMIPESVNLDLVLPSESESELESEEDVPSRLLTNNSSSVKRPARIKPRQIMKRPKLETLKQSLLESVKITDKPTKTSTDSVKEVFDYPSVNIKKPLSMKIMEKEKNDSTFTENVPMIIATEGFGKIHPSKTEDELPENKKSKYISSEELSKNRISQSDWQIVPAFKNYSKGIPSSKLYIKNLAKNVIEDDLKYIFGKYLRDEKEDISIRLMKEGRMKGQAFITYDKIDTACSALEEVNGYILKDKPMVIVYGKTKTETKGDDEKL